jgi:hypothetical protein
MIAHPDPAYKAGPAGRAPGQVCCLFVSLANQGYPLPIAILYEAQILHQRDQEIIGEGQRCALLLINVLIRKS